MSASSSQPPATVDLPPVTIRLAAPRGFCAGVDRAIDMVEKAIAKYGAPVYVRHEIVHNETVVARLRNLGAVFVDELDEVPDDRPVIFSAHGCSVLATSLQRHVWGNVAYLILHVSANIRRWD